MPQKHNSRWRKDVTKVITFHQRGQESLPVRSFDHSLTHTLKNVHETPARLGTGIQW